jgi:hypothetical protein
VYDGITTFLYNDTRTHTHLKGKGDGEHTVRHLFRGHGVDTYAFRGTVKQGEDFISSNLRGPDLSMISEFIFPVFTIR